MNTFNFLQDLKELCIVIQYEGTIKEIINTVKDELDIEISPETAMNIFLHFYSRNNIMEIEETIHENIYIRKKD